jgi:2-amino-4-hydroxy-6-hydroxymethyldihydropteridine diphosphokinase
MESALIALGSNVGDRSGFLARAAARLEAAPGIRWRRMSSIRETEPAGDPREGALGGLYLNAVVEVLTDLDPRALLGLCQTIERDEGRVRSGKNAPRTLDLDILLVGDRVIEEEGLVVPHPRMLERGFVLEPLAEIAPDRRHPVSGHTLREHWEEWRKSRDDRHR